MLKILGREVLSEWEKEFQKDINCLLDIWRKKKKELKKILRKTKHFFSEKPTQTKIKQMKKKTKISNTERNSSNINEGRTDPANPNRHNSDNYHHYRSRN